MLPVFFNYLHVENPDFQQFTRDNTLLLIRHVVFSKVYAGKYPFTNSTRSFFESLRGNQHFY